MVVNTDRWCFTFPARRPEAAGADRAALLTGARWKLGNTITISFLDGHPAIHERVIAAAKIWTEHLTSVNFEFRKDTSKTLVRISFSRPGSWSVLGNTCEQIAWPEPTMNFGWLTPDIPEEELRQVVLHEFGHALGLIHEHQNPNGGIQWNKKAVYDALKLPPNSWPEATIDRNIFEAYAARETNSTPVDSASIMMYPIPASWTLDGFSTGLNTELSDGDKQFLAQIYNSPG